MECTVDGMKIKMLQKKHYLTPPPPPYQLDLVQEIRLIKQ